MLSNLFLIFCYCQNFIHKFIFVKKKKIITISCSSLLGDWRKCDALSSVNNFDRLTKEECKWDRKSREICFWAQANFSGHNFFFTKCWLFPKLIIWQQVSKLRFEARWPPGKDKVRNPSSGLGLGVLNFVRCQFWKYFPRDRYSWLVHIFVYFLKVIPQIERDGLN
jgi:hypothetical protein